MVMEMQMGYTRAFEIDIDDAQKVTVEQNIFQLNSADCVSGDTDHGRAHFSSCQAHQMKIKHLCEGEYCISTEQ